MSYIGNPIVSTDFPVDYFSGNGSTTAFTLSIATASVNAVDVEVSGVSQSPQTYTISGTTLTFSAAPPSGTNNIVIKHRGVAGIPNVPSAASVGSSALSNLTTLPVSGGYTATLPSATGTVMVSGNMPAFSVYMGGSDTTFSASTATKVPLNTKVFDTASCFDATTNYRFTPNVAGYYQINASTYNYANAGGSTGTTWWTGIYKNGALFKRNVVVLNTNNFNQGVATLGDLIYMNGTTDYLELYIWSNVTTPTFYANSTTTYMSGSLVRTA